MPFSEEIKIRAMVSCGRRCCICHKFCGNNMEVHHIKAHADGGEDTFENAIPLCFDCHATVRQYDPKHPKGIKFSEKELILHRDNWYKHMSMEQQSEEIPNKEMQGYPEINQMNKTIVGRGISIQQNIIGNQFQNYIVALFNKDYYLNSTTMPNVRGKENLVYEYIDKMRSYIQYQIGFNAYGNPSGLYADYTIFKNEFVQYWSMALKDVTMDTQQLGNIFDTVVISQEQSKNLVTTSVYFNNGNALTVEGCLNAVYNVLKKYER